ASKTRRMRSADGRGVRSATVPMATPAIIAPARVAAVRADSRARERPLSRVMRPPAVGTSVSDRRNPCLSETRRAPACAGARRVLESGRESDVQRLCEKLRLFGRVPFGGARGRRGRGGTRYDAHGAVTQVLYRLERDERPRALVLGFVLHPDQLGIRVASDDLVEFRGRERVVLLQTDEGDAIVRLLLEFGAQVPVDLSGVEENALDRRRIRDAGVIDDGFELSAREVLDRTRRAAETEHCLRREH